MSFQANYASRLDKLAEKRRVLKRRSSAKEKLEVYGYG